MSVLSTQPDTSALPTIDNHVSGRQRPFFVAAAGRRCSRALAKQLYYPIDGRPNDSEQRRRVQRCPRPRVEHHRLKDCARGRAPQHKGVGPKARFQFQDKRFQALKDRKHEMSSLSY